MVDIHSHILPGLDDGPENLDVSIDMARMARDNGIKDIIATPHYISYDTENDRSRVDGKAARLLRALKNKGIDINIHPGNEVYLDASVPELLDKGTIHTLAGSRYILVEFPMTEIPHCANKVLYDIFIRGLVPIIAHPERNIALIEKPEMLIDFLNRGCLAQVNSSSITGVFGRKVKETAMLFIKHNQVHFAATDAHSCRGRSPRLKEANEIVKEHFGQEKADILFCKNGINVLKDEAIEALEPVEIKRKRRLEQWKWLKINGLWGRS